MATKQGVPVTKRALLQRINRRLRKEDEMVRATRGDGRARQELGDYYRINFNRNLLLEKQVDLEEVGRELGVLAAYERLEED